MSHSDGVAFDYETKAIGLGENVLDARESGCFPTSLICLKIRLIVDRVYANVIQQKAFPINCCIRNVLKTELNGLSGELRKVYLLGYPAIRLPVISPPIRIARWVLVGA